MWTHPPVDNTNSLARRARSANKAGMHKLDRTDAIYNSCDINLDMLWIKLIPVSFYVKDIEPKESWLDQIYRAPDGLNRAKDYFQPRRFIIN